MTTYGVDRSGSPASASAAGAESEGAGQGETFQPSDSLLTSISALSDPNADRILFWDDSDGNFGWLTAGTGLDITGTTLSVTLSVTNLDWDNVWADAVHSHQSSGEGGTIDHGAAITGLTDDDHTQYALLVGRSGGQTIIGGTGAGELLTLNGTSHAAGGDIVVGGGTSASAVRFLEPSGSGTHYSAFKAQAQAGNVTYILPAADATVSGYALKSNASGTLSWGAAGGTETKRSVTQTTHGFAVGDVLYITGTDTYAKADADAASTADVVGIVDSVTSADAFVLLVNGYMSTLSGLTAGVVYFLSATAGAYTATEPSTVGQISKPLFIAVSATEAYFFNWRGMLIGSPSSTLAVQRFSGDGSDTTFTLNTSPDENNTFVYVSGIYQQKDTYSISSTTLTFSGAPPTGTDNIEVVTVGAVSIGTPSDGTVTNAKLAAGALFTAGTEQATTSGTAVAFTGIPSGAQMVIVDLKAVSTNGTGRVGLRIGPVAGVETSGYVGAYALLGSAAVGGLVAPTDAIELASPSFVAGDSIQSCKVILTLEDASDNTWHASFAHWATYGGTGYITTGAFHKPLAGVLSVLSLVTDGTDTFDAGSINIMYR